MACFLPSSFVILPNISFFAQKAPKPAAAPPLHAPSGEELPPESPQNIDIRLSN
jgi:hypothetical protein